MKNKITSSNLIYLRNILFAIVLIVSVQLKAQQIDKNYVVLEVGTGTWCWACPFASIAAEKLLHEGKNVLIIKNSFNDQFETPASLSRIDLYGTTVFPETFFNGHKLIAGVPNDDDFLELYEQEIARKTSFNISLSYQFSNNNYIVDALVDKVADYEQEVVLHLFVVEDHIKYFWQDFMPVISFSNREMYPNVNGENLDFTESNIIEKIYSIPVDSSINYDNTTMVALIQNTSTKEILQATTVNLGYMAGDNNVSVDKVIFPELTNCEYVLAPQILIRNRGNNVLESAQITYGLNANETQLFNWTGSLLPNETQEIALSAININNGLIDSLYVTATLPNGVADDDNADNKLVQPFYNYVTSPLKLTLITNKSNENFYWQILNSDEIIESGSDYSEGDTIVEYLQFSSEDCYEFIVGDNDGWCTTEIILEDALGNQIYHLDDLMLDPMHSVFFRPKLLPPTLICNISDNQTGVSINDSIILTFNEPIRNIDDSEIQPEDLSTIASIKKNIVQTVAIEISINGAYNQIIIIPEEGLNYSTSYAIHVGNIESFNNIAFNDTIIKFVTEQEVGIQNNQKRSVIYPNPVNNKLFVNSTKSDITHIYNLSGKIVLTNELYEGMNTLNVSELEQGVYFIKIDNTIQKIVKN